MRVYRRLLLGRVVMVVVVVVVVVRNGNAFLSSRVEMPGKTRALQ